MAFYNGMKEGYSEDEKDDEKNFHFYYNHEDRIKNAPKIVQDFYDGKMNPPKGLFKVLVANKFNRFMLFTVALCFVIVLITNFFSRSPSLGVCAGFECELSAFVYDEQIFAQIKIHPLKKSLQDKNFKIGEYIKDEKQASAIFSFADADGQIVSRMQKNTLLQKNAFFLRTNTANYDIIETQVEVEILGERIELKTNIKKKE